MGFCGDCYYVNIIWFLLRIYPRNLNSRSYTYERLISSILYEQLRIRLEKAEKLLRVITYTGSHYQIKEKIEEYFEEIKKEEK